MSINHRPGERGKPCRDNGLDASFQLNDADLSLPVQMSSLDVEKVRPSSQTVCLSRIVEGIEDLHCSLD